MRTPWTLKTNICRNTLVTSGEGITGLKTRRLYLPTENKTTGATSEAGSTYPPGAPEFTPGF